MLWVSNKIKPSLAVVIIDFDHAFIDYEDALIRLKGICELPLLK